MSSLGSLNAFFAFLMSHSDWWVCIPEPLMPKNGLGMNVAYRPFGAAIALSVVLKVTALSAVRSASAYWKSISCWPVATSWCAVSTWIPKRLERVHHLLADLGAEVLGEVEVAGRVVRQRLDGAVRAAQQEELQLGPGVEDEAELLRAVHLAASTQRGSPGNGSPFGVKTSQMTRAEPVSSFVLAVWPDARLPGNLG